MTKGELFEKAWRLGFKGDFHLVDEIYHPDYKAIDHRFGIDTNIDSDKAIISTFANSIKIGPFRTIYESEKFLCIHRYLKLLERENLCVAIINAVTYRDSPQKVFVSRSALNSFLQGFPVALVVVQSETLNRNALMDPSLEGAG